MKENTHYSSIIIKERKKYKVSCFSETYKEILMWSHYGDKHRGICIGFDFPKLEKNKFIIVPVNYYHEINPIDGLAELSKNILYLFTTKSIRWEYEKEFRAISQSQTNNPVEYIKYDSSFIREIIFGCKVSEAKIKTAINKIQNSNIDFNNLTFKRMIIDRDTFLLKEEKIDPVMYIRNSFVKVNKK